MTQEQIIRRMLQGFVDDPPDSQYQEGFMDAVHLIANEVLGIEWNDPLLQKIDAMGREATPTILATLAKVKPVLALVPKGNPDQR